MSQGTPPSGWTRSNWSRYEVEPKL